ncbi:MAG: MazG nucleotide pyrophosphohydrolase domain-containing protein [Patescibacteria group bacterium]
MNRPQTLGEWQEMFDSIYGKHNASYTVSDILLHLIEEMGEIAEELRKENTPEVILKLPDIFAWLLSFCNACEPTAVDLEKAIRNKYPGVCPYCFAADTCTCIANAEPKPTYKSNSRMLEPFRNAAKEGLTLDEWQGLFARIYGPVNKIKTQMQLWLHLWEEIGELSKAFRIGRPDLEEEVADVFAWLIGISNKLFIFLANVTWNAYPGRCRKCSQKECQCQTITEREV